MGDLPNQSREVGKRFSERMMSEIVRMRWGLGKKEGM